MRPWRWLALAVLVLTLVGCATPGFDTEQAQVLKERAGKFSVLAQAPNEPPEAVQGSFVWRRLAQGWQLDLKSPLGSTLARLTILPDGATLEQPDAPVQRAASGEQLLASVLGASIPLDVLEDWIDGRVVDDDKVANVARDSEGRIVSFTQAGWLVNFDRYGPAGPARVSAEGRQFGRSVTLKLVADQAT